MGRFPFGDEEENNHGVARPTGGEVVIYEQRGGRVRLEVRLDGDTLWLSLAQMAELFGRHKSVISRHLRAVYSSRELRRTATVAENATVQREGGREVTRRVDYFNLDAILSVGYRVNSRRGTQFRIWATRTLRDHLLRGYTLNAEPAQAAREGPRRDGDERRLPGKPAHPRKPDRVLDLNGARTAIRELRRALPAGWSEAGLFGHERGDQLGAILGNLSSPRVRPGRRT